MMETLEEQTFRIANSCFTDQDGYSFEEAKKSEDFKIVCQMIKMAKDEERQACLDIVEEYQIPVGNSAAGEMACEWAYDALQEIQGMIKLRGIK